METILAESKHFSLDELCRLVDVPKRTVRFYMQEGLVNRPIGETKSAYYTDEHLSQLLEIKKWQNAGLTLARIKQLIRKEDDNGLLPPPRQIGSIEVWSHILLAHGVELHIDGKTAQVTPEQLRTFIREAQALYQQITAPAPKA